MSFSDFYPSDLTDITSSSDDDGEYTVVNAKRTGAKKPKRDQRSPYTILNPLRPPRSTSYSVRALYEQIIDGLINLDPEYQRDIVWPEQKQIGLVDSLFRNYYIPPIIFAVSTSEDGSESRVCIDGKQRLTSIQKFMDGLIPHRDHVTAKRYWCKNYGANARLLLPTPLQQAFANKQIVCVEYDSLSDEQEREIFQRVQLGVALTPAERMQAITGPWPTFIREIQSQVLGDDGFGNSFDWGRARGRDFHGLASIVYLIEQLPACKPPPTSQAMEKWLTRATPVPPKLRTSVLDTFRVYLTLAREKTYKKPLAQRVSPIEFVMIGVMIFMKRETLSLTQLSNAIERMRTDVRSVEQDVRSNGRVSKLLFKFIVEKLPKLVLRSDGQGDKSAQSSLSSLPRAPVSAASAITAFQRTATTTATVLKPGPRSAHAPGPKKRKRQTMNDDSDYSPDPGEGDQDYIPLPRKSAGRPAAKAARPAVTTDCPPSASELESTPPAPAPPRTSSFVVKTEKNASVTPTPSLTPLASSTTSQSETNSALVTPVPLPLPSPQIKSEKSEPITTPGTVRTPMDRLAALRAANARVASSASASTSPTAVAPVTDGSPDQLVQGSAIAPIDVEALDKLQQILSISAGIKAISDASMQQQTQSTLPQSISPGRPLDSQNNNLSAVLALQQLGAILSRQPQQQTQQTQEQPNAIPIPHPTVAPAVQIPVWPTIKTEHFEPRLTADVPRPPVGPRSTGSLPHRLNYRGGRSRSRDYDRRSYAWRVHEHEYERARGRGRGRGRAYHRRAHSPRSYSPRSRSRSRSYSRSRSRSYSRSPSRRFHRLGSRSRSWDRGGDYGDYGYHRAGSSTRGRDWRACLGASASTSTAGAPCGDSGGGSSGGGAGNAIGGSGGLEPGVDGYRHRSVSSTGRRRSSPSAGYAPRKFDYTRERLKREREYDEYRERKSSAGGSCHGPGPGGFGGR